jgi:flagellar FliL protein
MSDTPAPPPPAPAKKRRLLKTLLLGVVLLGAAGGGGFWWWKNGQAHAAEAPKEDAHEGGAVLGLEPFLVNLADREASRFLRVTVKLVVDEESFAKEFEENALQQSRARSTVLEHLTTLESTALVTPEGKAELKKQIAERTSAVLHTEVRDVLFTDFVVQF